MHKNSFKKDKGPKKVKGHKPSDELKVSNRVIEQQNKACNQRRRK